MTYELYFSNAVFKNLEHVVKSDRNCHIEMIT